MKSGFVGLAGRPNAGKSTLLNALMNEKISIVSPKPQTTRSEIRGILNTEDAQIIFTDTPGFNKPNHRLETRMFKQATSVIQGVDLVYFVVDGSVPFGSEDEFALQIISQLDIPVFLLLNKIDLLKKEEIINKLTYWQSRFDFAEYFPLSALMSTSYEDLLNTTIKYLPEGGPLYDRDIVSDNPLMFRISEIIREKVLLCTEQEVPHASAVYVESYEEEDNVVYIQAVILVERQGQKAILIGNKRSMISRIIRYATKDISELLNQKVNLDIFVRVEDKWRDNDSRLDEIGYGILDE